MTRWTRAVKKVVALRHIEIEGVGTLGDLLQKRGIPLRYVETSVPGAALPDLAEMRGLVVLGGPMGVYEADKYPYLADEMRLIKNAIEAGLPVLGICLGAQLIAGALGARVYKGPAPEVGWAPIYPTPEAEADPVFRGLGPAVEAFHWHGDTFDLPAGAIRFASSDRYENQAFRFGERAYALQFHLEVTGPMIRSWAKAYGHPGGAAPLLDVRRLAALKRVASTLFGRFLSLIP